MARPTYVLQAAFTTDPGDLLAAQTWVDLTSRLDVAAGVTITRGRTDEQGEIQPSVFGAMLDNRDGALTPAKSASPYYPNVVTGKMLRLGLTWPGGGVNFTTNPTTTADITGWSAGGSAPPTLSATTDTTPQAGTHTLKIVWGAGGTFPQAGITVPNLAVGKTYTASVYGRVPSGGVPANPHIGIVVAGGPVGSSTSLFDTWQRLTVTFTATATSHQIQVWPSTSPTAGNEARVNALQVEQGGTASAFVNTAQTFSWRFTGQVTEWPTAWEGGPAVLASSRISAVDKLGRTAELGEYRTTLQEDVLDDVPFAYYPLTEPAGVAGSTVSAGDVSGNDERPLTLRQTGSGGAVTFGAEVGVPDYYVGRETTAAINPASAGNGLYLRASLKTLRTSSAGASVSCIAQESISPLTNAPLVILTATNGSWFGVRKNNAGEITAAFSDANPGGSFHEINPFGATLSSSTPELLTAILEYDTPTPGDAKLSFWINGVQFGTAISWPMPPATWAVASVGGRAGELYRGYVSHAAFFNAPVSAGAMAGWWYSAFKGTDGAGSTSYARLNKMCVYSDLEPPLTWSGTSFTPQSVGPQEIEGQPVDAMHLVESTEDGSFFLSGAGVPVLRLRHYRFNRAASLTLAADRLDPNALTFRGDDYGLVNDVTAARPDGAGSRVINTASVAASGRRKANVEAIPTTDDGLRALAAWRANTWGSQRNRPTGLRVSLLNDATLVPSVLALDLDQKIAITGLPSQAPGSALELITEGWTERIGEYEWTMEFVTTPADAYDVWQIGTAGHSEIGTTTRIGY